MKTCIGLLLYLVFLCVGVPATRGEDAMAKGDVEKIPRQVGKYRVSEDVVAQAELFSAKCQKGFALSPRAEYLVGILTSNIVAEAQTNDTEVADLLIYKKASAIKLLGSLKEKAAVQPLVSNIEFNDARTKTYPVVHALSEIGEDSIPSLMDLVRQEKKGKRIELAVQALMLIKGKEYDEFVASQKSKLPSDAFRNLLRFAIDD